jgi:hypothetical protein
MFQSVVRIDPNDPAVNWLLHSEDPSIRYLALTEVLCEPEESGEVKAARRRIIKGPRLQALLANQRADGGFGVHPYRKWTGAHWRLVSCVELRVPNGNKIVLKAAEQVLEWLDRTRPPKINGLWRAHASMQGNALGVCSRLGLAGDPRAERLARSLVEWQWPDGGWNCDVRKEARHSSFYESLAPLWGLTEYRRATHDQESSGAAEKAVEFFLRHLLFRSCSTGKVINYQWLKLHYPLYWHYDILQALRIMMLANRLGDPRTEEALDIVESKRLKDGRWRPEGYYWYPRNRTKTTEGRRVSSGGEVVDWGRDGPNEMITLNALRVLRGSGRIR